MIFVSVIKYFLTEKITVIIILFCENNKKKTLFILKTCKISNALVMFYFHKFWRENFPKIYSLKRDLNWKVVLVLCQLCWTYFLWLATVLCFTAIWPLFTPEESCIKWKNFYLGNRAIKRNFQCNKQNVARIEGE